MVPLSLKIVSDNLRLTDRAKTETSKCGRQLTHQRKHRELGGEEQATIFTHLLSAPPNEHANFNHRCNLYNTTLESFLLRESFPWKADCRAGLIRTIWAACPCTICLLHFLGTGFDFAELSAYSTLHAACMLISFTPQASSIK